MHQAFYAKIEKILKRNF